MRFTQHPRQFSLVFILFLLVIISSTSFAKDKAIVVKDNTVTQKTADDQKPETETEVKSETQKEATADDSKESAEDPLSAEEIESDSAHAEEATSGTTQHPIKNLPLSAIQKAKAKSLYANVSFRERTIFKIHYVDESQAEATLKRARLASKALEEAMNAEYPLEPKAKPAQVNITPTNQVEIRIRGYKIIELSDEDRLARGFMTTKEYQESLQTDLNVFVGNEMQRLQIQKVALQFFLSVFFALLGFLILRQIRNFFNQADLMIEEKKESLKPMTFMSETLVSSQALGGLFALFLVIGRVLAYSVVTLTTAAAILGQFSTTRNAMGEFFSKVFSESLSNLQSLIELLPGFVLAIVLLFLWNLSIKILDLFLRGVRSGRISWSFLQANRISIVRFWGISILSIIFFPLVLASLFGRFNNPLEYVVIGCSVILCLALLPILVSIAAGSFVLWFGQIYPGQWIRIGDILGEVTEVSLFRITLVPQEGGRIYVPMLRLLFQPMTEMRESHRREFRFKVQRLLNLAETTSRLEQLFPQNFKIQIQCLSLSSSEYHFALFTPSFSGEVRSEILNLLSTAHDQKNVLLTTDLIEEVAH